MKFSQFFVSEPASNQITQNKKSTTFYFLFFSETFEIFKKLYVQNIEKFIRKKIFSNVKGAIT